MEAFLLVVTLLVGNMPTDIVEVGFSEASCVTRMVTVGNTPAPVIDEYAQVVVAKLPAHRMMPAIARTPESTRLAIVNSMEFKGARCVSESTFLHETREQRHTGTPA